MKRRIFAFLLSLTIVFSLTANGFPVHAESIEGCTCNAEADENGVVTHIEGCTLYEAPPEEPSEEPQNVEPQCNCTPVEGVHANSCPLYKEPEGPVCTCTPVDGVHAETCDLYVAPVDTTPVCNCTPVEGVHAETCPLYKAPEDTTPVCNCTPVEGVHAETCPLYKAPEEPSEPQCTCGAVADENGVITHLEGCELFEETEESLFDRLMACAALEDMEALWNAASEEERAALTEEQIAALQEKETKMRAEVVLPEPVDGPSFEWKSPVNFTNVAPFLPPVAGRSVMPFAMFAAPFAETYGEAPEGIGYNKTAAMGTDGKTATITLEAFAKGEEILTEVTTDVPTDIVLVLDESSSMELPFDWEWVRFANKTNAQYLQQSAYDGYIEHVKLWYMLDSGKYASLIVQLWNGNYIYGYYDDNNAWINVNGGNNGNRTPNGIDTSRIYVQNVTKTRMDALQDALGVFVGQINDKADGANNTLGDADDVNHRVAIVGFASSSELMCSMQSMNTTAGQAAVENAIDRLGFKGDTQIDDGMALAKDVLDTNPVPAGEKRNRVVVAFTDGYPGSNIGQVQWDVAQPALDVSASIKAEGVNVYSIGIFPEANPGNAGDRNGNAAAQANYFMQNLSSNDGKVSSPSFYLSASNTSGLIEIFKQIVDNIGTGGSSTTLGAEAVITDVISDNFVLPAGTTKNDIKLYTSEYNGDGTNYSGNVWENRTPLSSDGVTVNPATGELSVTGFDYSENWCGKDADNKPRGKKLIIQFNVEVKDGYLGGNNVPTNKEAHLYENSDAVTKNEPLLDYPVPEVNVPIGNVTVGAQEKNVYVLGNLTVDQLKNGTTVDVGGVSVSIDPEADNYGLQAWQNDRVDINVEVTDANGNVITTGFEKLEDDTTYNIKVTVSPKAQYTGAGADGTPASAKNGIDEDVNIYVWHPTLTFKDSVVYYGDTAPVNPDDFNTNNLKPGITWTHEDLTYDPTKMIGEEPLATDFGIEYTPEEGKIVDGKIATKDDIPVQAEVKLFGQTIDVKFAHECDCTLDEGKTCSWNETELDGNPAFLLHPKTCSLIIDKTVVNAPTDDHDYVFTVKGGNIDVGLTVVVHGDGSVTIKELPTGTYVIDELENWSWRCDEVEGEGNITLSKAGNNVITITNKYTNNKWLDGNTSCDNQWTAPAVAVTED